MELATVAQKKLREVKGKHLSKYSYWTLLIAEGKILLYIEHLTVVAKTRAGSRLSVQGHRVAEEA